MVESLDCPTDLVLSPRIQADFKIACCQLMQSRSKILNGTADPVGKIYDASKCKNPDYGAQKNKRIGKSSS
jgi:hypothetical protein